MGKLNEFLWVFLWMVIPRAYALVIAGRTILSALFLLVATILAIEKNFDLLSSLTVIAFILGTFGCLPFFLSVKNCPIPKVRYAILGLVVSGGWLLFAGITALGMIYSYLPFRMFYWNIVTLVLLADLPMFLFCAATSIPKTRSILAEEFTALEETIKKVRAEREKKAQSNTSEEPRGV